MTDPITDEDLDDVEHTLGVSGLCARGEADVRQMVARIRADAATIADLRAQLADRDATIGRAARAVLEADIFIRRTTPSTPVSACAAAGAAMADALDRLRKAMEKWPPGIPPT